MSATTFSAITGLMAAGVVVMVGLQTRRHRYNQIRDNDRRQAWQTAMGHGT